MNMIPLSTLRLGEKAVVRALSPHCPGHQRHRLSDLGFVPGTLVHVELISPLGNPVAYQVHGASIALRRDQSQHILVERGDSSTLNAQGNAS